MHPALKPTSEVDAATGMVYASGLWQLEANEPLVVSDPEKARYLLGLTQRLPSAQARKNHEAGVMPLGILLKARRGLFVRDKQAYSHLEALCSGARVKARDEWRNVVTNEGLNYALDAALSGGTPDNSWFVLLTSSNPAVLPTNTLASHPGWTEVLAYSIPTSPNRDTWDEQGVSAQSISNTGFAAVFTINADTTIVGGAGLSSIISGTGGTLYAVGAFTAADKSLDLNDTLSVTVTATLAAA